MPDPSALIPASQLPADVAINKDAGRGNLLFVTLRLESGEELPFFVDTGSPATLFDKSLEPKLGTRIGTGAFSNFGTKHEMDIYAAPKLYLGSTQLMTGRNICAADFKSLSSKAGRPIMGILGRDCLDHYCIQLDFEAGKMRFLNADHINTAELGKAFPLKFHQGWYIYDAGLLGGTNIDLGIDTGYRVDGALDPELFRQEVAEQRLQAKDAVVNSQDNGRVWFPKSVWNGKTYQSLLIGNGANLIGLGFLARHLVTFDFPKQAMYLKQTSVGPLVDEKMEAAAEFINRLRKNGQLPGWSKDDIGTIYLEPYPGFEAFDGRKNGDLSTYHYKVSRASQDAPWKLQKAWRTDQNDLTVEEYSVL
jgi:hypothetical protein